MGGGARKAWGCQHTKLTTLLLVTDRWPSRMICGLPTPRAKFEGGALAALVLLAPGATPPPIRPATGADVPRVPGRPDCMNSKHITRHLTLPKRDMCVCKRLQTKLWV